MALDTQEACFLLWCAHTSQVKTTQQSVPHQYFIKRCYLFLVHWLVCFHMCSFITTQSKHTTMIEWTQTGTVHCHICCVICKCLNNQIQPPLFNLAFCFHQHITPTSLHSHWLLWITHVTHQTMDRTLLHSVLLSSFVFHHPHHRSQDAWQRLFNNNEFQTLKETKWASLTIWFRCHFASFFFV